MKTAEYPETFEEWMELDYETVSECCGAGIDTDIPICQECREWSDPVRVIIDEPTHRYQSMTFTQYWEEIYPKAKPGSDMEIFKESAFYAYSHGIHFQHVINNLKTK